MKFFSSSVTCQTQPCKGIFKLLRNKKRDLRRKWERENVTKILFLAKQDVLWCFISKATKAQKADRAGWGAKSAALKTSSGDRKRGWKEARERERRRWCTMRTLTKGEAVRRKLMREIKTLSNRQWNMAAGADREESRRDEREESGVARRRWRWLMQHTVTSTLQQSWAQH